MTPSRREVLLLITAVAMRFSRLCIMFPHFGQCGWMSLGKKKVLYFTVEEIWGNYFSITVTFVNYSFEVSVTEVFLFLFIPQHAHAPQRSSIVQMDVASLVHGNVMGKMSDEQGCTCKFAVE